MWLDRRVDTNFAAIERNERNEGKERMEDGNML